MNVLDQVATTAESFGLLEDPEPAEGIETMDAADLDEFLARLSLYARAIRHLQSQGRRRFGELLGARGFVRFGDRAYRAAPDDTERLKPEHRTEFYRLVEDAGLVAEVFPTHNVRKGGLRRVAESYVDPETGEVGWPAFRAHFYDVTEGEAVKVTEVPLDKAPKYIASAAEGIVHRRGA